MRVPLQPTQVQLRHSWVRRSTSSSPCLTPMCGSMRLLLTCGCGAKISYVDSPPSFLCISIIPLHNLYSATVRTRLLPHICHGDRSVSGRSGLVAPPLPSSGPTARLRHTSICYTVATLMCLRSAPSSLHSTHMRRKCSLSSHSSLGHYLRTTLLLLLLLPVLSHSTSSALLTSAPPSSISITTFHSSL